MLAATCEMARELLITDRTAAPAGEGLKYQNVGPDQTGYDKTDNAAEFFTARRLLIERVQLVANP